MVLANVQWKRYDNGVNDDTLAKALAIIRGTDDGGSQISVERRAEKHSLLRQLKLFG